MSAICDSCSRPQPADWRGGDHCIWCGEAVRREVRCFWCANWTPAVKFCRTCGAATVSPTVYGAARMLKDAGCDRFTIPRQLTELDPEQIENFTRIYQEHAAIAAHHVEQLQFLEQHLEQQHWSAALDEVLAAQLPWPLDRLATMRAAARQVPPQASELEKTCAIGRVSPFSITRSLAEIARLALADWTALDGVMSLVGNSDEAMSTEAVLAASHWRVLYGPGLPSRRREVIDRLRRCPLRDKAAIRLALLGEATGEPLPAGDFATALVNNDVDFLGAAANAPGDDLRRFAAAQKLIALGHLAPIAGTLQSLSEDQQGELLAQLERRRKPAPELRAALFDVARDTGSSRVRQYACYVLCYGCPPEEALRIARAARGEARVYQALLQKAGLPPSALEEFGEFLLEAGAFSMNQYGMNDVAKQGRMPADFVQRHWPDADVDARVELCKCAEAQLGEYGDDALHRFLVDVAFTPAMAQTDVKVAGQAWCGLHRWYDSFGFPRRRPVKVSAQSIEKFFGSPREFLIRLATLLMERPHRDAVTEILAYPDSSAMYGISQFRREAMDLAKALADAMRDGDVDFGQRLKCTDFLGFLGSEASLRTPVTRLLRSFASTDLDLQSTRALDRIAHGPTWSNEG
jgi:hypothetical protein